MLLRFWISSFRKPFTLDCERDASLMGTLPILVGQDILTYSGRDIQPAPIALRLYTQSVQDAQTYAASASSEVAFLCASCTNMAPRGGQNP